ncbi:recombinase family protein [Siccirubricoccus phaeus]|uniref:recombinase family protein n=1 Tax=Siccirubricoccus phaeus TaxID=2595053 RepID=UPI0011F2CF13|nr:recombinase family protein [Siccirubricoccus phaeus]
MRFIAYHRVSTDKQGRSGLGLEAQREAVNQYVRRAGGVVLAEFTEVESGKRADRPELAKAMAMCRSHRAVLVIAKLDRLSRNVAFISALMESGVEFVACDNPTATKLTIHILAAVAENEREAISARTKAALAAAKARGTKLGGWRGGPAPSAEMQAAGGRARAAKADRVAADLAPLVERLRAEGKAPTLAALAAELNASGAPAPGGGEWSIMGACRLSRRIAALPQQRAA